MDGSGGISHPEDVGPLSLSDFMERWATSMPGVETPSEELLKVCRLVYSFELFRCIVAFFSVVIDRLWRNFGLVII